MAGFPQPGKNSEIDKLAASQGQKAHRHLVGCLALDPTMTDVWQELTHTVRGSQNLEKTDEWISWTKMLQEWSEEELTMHIHSGRISERECPDTPGVWEFKDNNKVKTTKVLGRDKQLSKSSKSQLKPETKEDDDDDWDKAWTAFGSASSFNDIQLFGTGSSIAKGKGSMKGKTSKGIGKKGKANKDDEEQVTKKQIQWLKSALSKAITVVGCKAFETTDGDKRGHAAKAKGELEEILSKVSDKGDVWEHKEFQAIQQNAKEKIALRKEIFG